MGMSTHIYGFRQEDETYKKMEAAYKACVAAGVDPPEEIDDYLSNCEPKYGYGKNVDISTAVTEGSNHNMDMYWEVDLTKLPAGVVKIRFINSY